MKKKEELTIKELCDLEYKNKNLAVPLGWINNKENVTGNNAIGCNGSISITLITFATSIISLSALLIIKRRGKYENKDL